MWFQQRSEQERGTITPIGIVTLRNQNALLPFVVIAVVTSGTSVRRDARAYLVFQPWRHNCLEANRTVFGKSTRTALPRRCDSRARHDELEEFVRCYRFVMATGSAKIFSFGTATTVWKKLYRVGSIAIPLPMRHVAIAFAAPVEQFYSIPVLRTPAQEHLTLDS
jgi:hypothetical protein